MSTSEDMVEAVTGVSHARYAVASWGRDGWDLGQWPYVVVYHQQRDDGWRMVVCVEGDLEVTEYATREELDRATDAVALFYWQQQGASWVQRRDGMPAYTVDTMPHKLRGPYRRTP